MKKLHLNDTGQNNNRYFLSLDYKELRERLDLEDDKFFNRTNIFLTANTLQLFLYGAVKYTQNSYFAICLSFFFLTICSLWFLVGLQSRNFLHMLFKHPNIQAHAIVRMANSKNALFSIVSTINLIGIVLPSLFATLWIILFIISIKSVL